MPSTDAFMDNLRRQQRAREHEQRRSLTTDEVKQHPERFGQLDIRECAEYDRRAHAREMAWLTDFFHEAVVRLFTPAHLRSNNAD